MRSNRIPGHSSVFSLYSTLKRIFPSTCLHSSDNQALETAAVKEEEVFADVTVEEYEKAVEEANAKEKKWRLFKK